MRPIATPIPSSRSPCPRSSVTIDAGCAPNGGADADFRRPLCRDVRHHSIETKSREYQRDNHLAAPRHRKDLFVTGRSGVGPPQNPPSK